MRPDLRLYSEDDDRPKLRVRTEPRRKPEPYFAVYAVRYVHNDPTNIMDGEQIARFEGHEAEAALGLAERLVRDPRALAEKHTVKDADALVVNDHRGKEWGRLPILGIVPATQGRGWRRMIADLWRKMLGY